MLHYSWHVFWLCTHGACWYRKGACFMFLGDKLVPPFNMLLLNTSLPDSYFNNGNNQRSREFSGYICGRGQLQLHWWSNEIHRLWENFQGFMPGWTLIWGCFDEFNHIMLPVLSVILSNYFPSKMPRSKAWTYFNSPATQKMWYCSQSEPFSSRWIAGIGYTGRQELPGNLKAL